MPDKPEKIKQSFTLVEKFTISKFLLLKNYYIKVRAIDNTDLFGTNFFLYKKDYEEIFEVPIEQWTQLTVGNNYLLTFCRNEEGAFVLQRL
jgi:hypothetical protein